jgi:hypothetical protein
MGFSKVLIAIWYVTVLWGVWQLEAALKSRRRVNTASKFHLLGRRINTDVRLYIIFHIEGLPNLCLEYHPCEDIVDYPKLIKIVLSVLTNVRGSVKYLVFYSSTLYDLHSNKCRT